MSKKLKKQEYSKYEPKKKYTPYEINKYKKKKRQDEFLKTLEPKTTTPKEKTESEFSAVNKLKSLSIAVPGSIMLNAQSLELQTYLAGQIARAAAIYRVDEVVIFDDTNSSPVGDNLPGDDKKWNACLKLGRILQYLECPQYLRKLVFPMHKHLEHAGLLNPLDAPHHFRVDEQNVGFREGIVTDKLVKEGKGSYVNVGLYREVQVDKTLVSGTRVTVKILPNSDPTSKKMKGIIVPPTLPTAELNLYWGYNVRLAKSLAEVVAECPYEKGYDLTIGTSDKGKDCRTISFGEFRHCLIVFGGVEGLETILESDETLKVENVSELFDFYLNTCPDQGSRTIRTEEAILITLAQITNKLPT